jgi:cytochrome c553
MAAASQAQTISPASVTLKPSQTQSFSVTNAAKGAYTWSLNPGVGSAGTVTSAGLYTAPASITAVTTVTLDATEPGHPGLTASITLMPLVGISVSPTWISLTNGQSAAFTATITGASNTAVTWSRPQVGTITSGGVYTVPATLTSSQNITVTATSVVDPTKSASLTIALVPTIGVALNPTSTSLTAGQSTALNAAVTGTTNTGLNWSMSPQVGTLSGGVYTAPSPIPSAESVTITATSQASTGRSANVTLSLVPVSVGVSPSSASLTSGQSKTFTASVSGSSNTGVTWSVSPSVGTVSGGVYKAPALVSTAQSVTVKATSAADGTKSASAVVSLTPSASINMTPTTASLQAGQSTSFNATVSGTSNTSVNWSMSPSVGTLSGGVYTAPTPVASAQTVTITAASAAVPSETVTAKVTLVPVAITVSPTSASLTGGQSTTLTANVSGSSNTSVNWSVSPSVGAVVGGVYTAPATIASAQTVTVTASSAADATKSATSKISLVPVALSVSPTSASLSAGQSKTLTATVTGSSNTSVNWSLSPAVGSIVAGVYTAPSTIASAQTVIATASSAANSAVTASASISLVPTAPTVSISVSPTSASLSSGQSATIVPTVTGSSNTSVTWSISPAVGTLAGGVYTAPTTISTQQTVTVTATSVAAATQSASASITLLPTVTVAVVPATITLGPSQSQQFNASLSGTSNPNVTWSISPSVGSFSNGLYQAPATINSQQNVTVTATSSAQPSQSGSATITLVPTVGIALSPSSISLTGGQSTQFNVTNAGAPASASTVTWTLAPPVGNITNGVYTAPVSISSLQTIVLTVASIANQSQTATANITLSPAAAPSTSVSPGTASLTPSGTQQFTATGLGTNPVWTISPSTGTITTGGLYSAPSSVTTQTTVTVTATNATNSSQTATATVTLSPAASQSPTSITLPLEVMGANGTQVPVSFNIPTGTSLSGLQLYLQIHGLKYETEASVQVNGGAWLPINTSTVTLQGYAAGVGGIGGGFATLKLTMNLPAGSITTGQNTLTFQFIATNGITSGYRVLNFNIQTSNGTQLIPASTFVQDDPSTWQAPLNDATDIQAGQTLYTTGHLAVPGSGAIQATCSMCHTQNGWDLKYFNYSNYSIQQRAMFHGLTAQQGNQIASYIRSLTSPAPASARPWNPPYQPGVGLDSVPVSEWAAGAGIDAVLDNDTDTLQYVMPGGSTANMAWNAFLNQREIPIAIQLRDWNNWLPTIHPVDAFGDTFTSNGLNTMYSQVRAELVPNDAASYSLHHMDLLFWLANQNGFYDTVRQPQTSTVWNNPAYTRSIYSAAQWMLVKTWEINQEYGLEGMPQAAFGPQAESRAWYANQAFFLSPQMLKIPQAAPGIGGTTPDQINSLHMYDAFAWYQLQLILNDGNGTASGTWPIDRGYSLAYLEGTLTWDGVTNSVRMPTAGLFMEWFAKVMQSGDLQDVNPFFLVMNPTPYSTFTGVSASEKVQLMNTWITLWLADAHHYTTAEFLKTPGLTPTFTLLVPGSFTGDLVWALPALRFQGVETSLLDQLVTFASGIWPSYNWAADLDQPCTQGGLTVTCQ